MQHNVLVLLPPVVVLICAFATKRLNLSLIIGLILAALIAASCAPIPAAKLLGIRLWEQATDADTLYNFAFLLVLGVIITILSYTGGAAAFAGILTKRIGSAKGAETSSFFLSITLFIDDYLSGLTVGHVMHHLTDRFRIPRVKLAFLLRAMTGPLIILAPISSWIAMITSQIGSAGVSNTSATAPITADPFSLFVASIPFIMYSLVLIPSVFYIIQARISYGPIHTQEKIAHETGNLFGGKEPTHVQAIVAENASHSIADLLVPLATLIGGFFAGILYFGGFHLFGGTKTFLEVFKSDMETAYILFMVGLITLVITFIFSLMRHKITVAAIPQLVKEGVMSMYSSIVMLYLAITLGILLRKDLETGQYLANLLVGSISEMFLPLMFFGIAFAIGLAIGSAWGTITLMLPIAIPMVLQFANLPMPVNPEQLMMLLPVLGAIFSGAVAGNHLSPIADMTVLITSSSGAYPMDHLQTQIPYVVPALIGTACAFLLMGMFASSAWTLKILLPVTVGFLVSVVLLYLCNRLLKK
jgi:tetracycline resistance efflux pump